MDKVYQVKRKTNFPIIANVPHSATYVPGDILKSFLITLNEYSKECLVMTDAYVDELFSFIGNNFGTMIRYNISRIVVDPERFEDDAKESMSKKGMGVIYEQTHDGRPLRKKLSAKQREVLLDNYYRPYHKAIESEVESFLDKFSKCLILDCHSFPSKALPFEDSSLKRPDICIGTDDFHTPGKIITSIQNSCKEIGWSTFLNEPFAGTYVPLKYLGKNQNVLSVMIEVNRKLYMNEKTGDELDSFSDVEPKLSEIVEDLVEYI